MNHHPLRYLSGYNRGQVREGRAGRIVQAHVKWIAKRSLPVVEGCSCTKVKISTEQASKGSGEEQFQ